MITLPFRKKRSVLKEMGEYLFQAACWAGIALMFLLEKTVDVLRTAYSFLAQQEKNRRAKKAYEHEKEKDYLKEPVKFEGPDFKPEGENLQVIWLVRTQALKAKQLEFWNLHKYGESLFSRLEQKEKVKESQIKWFLESCEKCFAR